WRSSGRIGGICGRGDWGLGTGDWGLGTGLPLGPGLRRGTKCPAWSPILNEVQRGGRFSKVEENRKVEEVDNPVDRQGVIADFPVRLAHPAAFDGVGVILAVAALGA